MFCDKNAPLNLIIVPNIGKLWCAEVSDFWGPPSNDRKRYQKILSVCSIGCKNWLNFTWTAMKLNKCYHTNQHIHSKSRIDDIKKKKKFKTGLSVHSLQVFFVQDDKFFLILRQTRHYHYMVFYRLRQDAITIKCEFLSCGIHIRTLAQYTNFWKNLLKNRFLGEFSKIIYKDII